MRELPHQMTDPFALDGEVEIVAHRGFSAEAPENTLSALVAGVEAGADAVEFDLHTAADGTAVLLHDETLRRTTNGRGRVTDYSAAELGALDAGSWFASEFAGEPVPTLSAALARLSDSNVRIYAEVKGVRRIDDVPGIVADVHEAGVADRTVYISMTWELLAAIREADPEALVGYIVEKRRRADDALGLAVGDPRALLDFDARILLRDRSWAERATRAGVPLACWTVDSPHDAEELVALGVPRITTNRVRRLVAWRDERGRPQ